MSGGHSVSEAGVAMPDKSILRHIRYEHLVAGVCGGVSATICLHPLDLVKIRLQGEIIDSCPINNVLCLLFRYFRKL